MCDVWSGCVLCVLMTYPCTDICAYTMPLPFTSDCQEEVHHNLHPFNQAPRASGVLLSDAFSSSCVLSRHSRYTCSTLHRACEHTLTTKLHPDLHDLRPIPKLMLLLVLPMHSWVCCKRWDRLKVEMSPPCAVVWCRVVELLWSPQCSVQSHDVAVPHPHTADMFGFLVRWPSDPEHEKLLAFRLVSSETTAADLTDQLCKQLASLNYVTDHVRRHCTHSILEGSTVCVCDTVCVCVCVRACVCARVRLNVVRH